MRFILFFLFLILPGFLFAQTQDTSRTGDYGETNILYRNEASGGLVAHGNGFGITFKRAWHKTGSKKRILDIDFVSMRHPKQQKYTNPYYDQSRPFFYGKLNFAYFLRGGYGGQNVIFGKGEKSGVEVRYIYSAGLTMGITKPVYLDVLMPFDSLRSTVVTVKYDPNDPLQQQPENILAPGPYFKGMDQLKLYPGAFGKFGFSFEYAGWQQKITAIEVGMVVDVFPKQIPIMAYIENNQVYFNFYVSLVWGGKW
jgi:hypothetical protein